jgi:deoxycytidylate deaminase
MAPNGDVYFNMPTWWRCLGPNGRDDGNHFTLPPGSVPLVPQKDVESRSWPGMRYEYPVPAFAPDRPDWDSYFLGIARAVSARSDCERDNVGAVVVKDRRIRATGYNGAPAGHPGCLSCPRRTSGCEPGSSYDNCHAIHAEANALLYCDRTDLLDAELYVTRKPCIACSKLIAGAGITRIITPEDL